jgi:hypothetical protein
MPQIRALGAFVLHPNLELFSALYRRQAVPLHLIADDIGCGI